MHSVRSSEPDGCYAGVCLCLAAFAPISCIREEGNFRYARECLCACIRVGLLPEGTSLSGRFSLQICSGPYETGPFVCTGRFLRFDQPNVGNFIPALILTLLRMCRELLGLMKDMLLTCVRVQGVLKNYTDRL